MSQGRGSGSGIGPSWSVEGKSDMPAEDVLSPTSLVSGSFLGAGSQDL